MTRRIQYGLLAVLLGFFIWRGLIPAFTVIDTDFPNYYASARLALSGEFNRVYEDDWFQRRIYSMGMNQEGKFAPYPPVTAFVAMPFCWLSPLSALRVWTALNLTVLVGMILLLAQLTRKDWLWSSLIVLLSGHALINNFRFGQFYLILTFMTLLAFFLWQRKRHWTSGALFGMGAVVKYFPIIFLPLCVSRREWKIVLSLALSIIVLLAGSLLVLGIEPYRSFLNDVLFHHLSGDIQNPFSSTFQSWNSLFRRLMIFDPALNRSPLINSAFFYTLSLCTVYCIVAGLVFAGIWKIRQNWRNDSLQLEFALTCLGGILLFPASATYHFLLLILPVSVLLSHGEEKWCVEQKFLLGLYACIGFLPYSLFRTFEGRGILTLLAYPRLILCTIIFGAALSFILRTSAAYSKQDIQVEFA